MTPRLLGFRDEPCAVYVLSCHHLAIAPPPSLDNGDAEIHPAFVECPTCGFRRRVVTYDGLGLHLDEEEARAIVEDVNDTQTICAALVEHDLARTVHLRVPVGR